MGEEKRCQVKNLYAFSIYLLSIQDNDYMAKGIGVKNY